MKRILTMILAVAMVFTMVSTAALVSAKESSFTDVIGTKDEWANEYIEKMVEKKILDGVGGGKFEPEGLLTREQFAKVLVAAIPQEDKGITAEFDDVTEGQWYVDYIEKAVASGIMKGKGDGKFGVGENIKRCDMALGIARLDKTDEELKAYEDKIPDSVGDKETIPEYAKGAMGYCYEKGIFSGDEKGNFNPFDNTTRAQIAKVICVYVEGLEEEPTDEPTKEPTKEPTSEPTGEEPTKEPTKEETGEMEKKPEDYKTFNTNLYMAEKRAFELGEYTDVTIEDNGIVLTENSVEGTYISPVITSYYEATKALISWNCMTSNDSYIEIYFKFNINGENRWTDWQKFITWSQNTNYRGSVDYANDDVTAGTDGISLKSGKTFNDFQYKVVLKKLNDDASSPIFKRVTLSCTLKGYSCDVSAENYLIELDVPEKSQRTDVNDPDLQWRVCSPSSTNMIMSYFGYDEDIETSAWGIKDNSAVNGGGFNSFGNWALNMAYASEKGFETYVYEWQDFDEIKNIVAEGIPVAIGIIGDLPGSAVGTTEGHLIVIRGFKIGDDGKEYAVINDPWATGIGRYDKVRREVLVEDLIRCSKANWKITYIFK